jgi:hypothetical protein
MDTDKMDKVSRTVQRKIKISYLTLLIIASVTLCSCETDETRTKKSNETVRAFMANLPLDNYEILYKYYPDFERVGKYWKYNKFNIESTSIDETKSASVICSTEFGSIFFRLKNLDGSYIITESKGLSAAFNTPLYKYCKNIGCIRANDYDVDIAQICKDKEDEFRALVYEAKESIESNFEISNNNLRIRSGGFGQTYVSGEVTVRNNSRFSIPAWKYEVYFHFVNSNGDIVFTESDRMNFEDIPYGHSLTKSLMVDETSYGAFKKVKAQLKLTSISFIEEVIAEHTTGDNCFSSTQSLLPQTEYNVYRIDFGIFDKSTNKFETVRSLEVDNRAFLSKNIFKVQKKDLTYDIFNISSFSNEETSEKTTYKIKAIWQNENEEVIMMYIDIKGQREIIVFGPGYSINYYLSD